MHREALDLVQFHSWDFNVPGMMETAFDLVKLQEKGKIRNIGMCNMDTNALKQMVDAGIPVVSNQAQYSVLTAVRENTFGLQRRARHLHIRLRHTGRWISRGALHGKDI